MKKKKGKKKNYKIDDKKEPKNEIIEYKGKNLSVSLESKLTNIFFDQKPIIDGDDMNELKKFLGLY